MFYILFYSHIQVLQLLTVRQLQPSTENDDGSCRLQMTTAVESYSIRALRCDGTWPINEVEEFWSWERFPLSCATTTFWFEKYAVTSSSLVSFSLSRKIHSSLTAYNALLLKRRRPPYKRLNGFYTMRVLPIISILGMRVGNRRSVVVELF